MTINRTHAPINNDPLIEVEEFTYLGSVLSKDNGAGKDMKARLSKARAAFAKLHLKVEWIQSWEHRNTSIAAMWNQSECWCIIESNIKKIVVFHNSCLREINRIFRPNKIRNKDILKKSKYKTIAGETKQRRIWWLGHVIRMAPNRIPIIALHWTLPGKRKRVRPRKTTITLELGKMSQAQYVTKDRGG